MKNGMADIKVFMGLRTNLVQVGSNSRSALLPGERDSKGGI